MPDGGVGALPPQLARVASAKLANNNLALDCLLVFDGLGTRITKAKTKPSDYGKKRKVDCAAMARVVGRNNDRR